VFIHLCMLSSDEKSQGITHIRAKQTCMCIMPWLLSSFSLYWWLSGPENKFQITHIQNTPKIWWN